MTGISNKYSNQFIQRGIQTILLTNLLPNTSIILFLNNKVIIKLIIL